LHFYFKIFKSIWRGYMRYPLPLSPPPPVWIYGEIVICSKFICSKIGISN
jgi:hypothetical protein